MKCQVKILDPNAIASEAGLLDFMSYMVAASWHLNRQNSYSREQIAEGFKVNTNDLMQMGSTNAQAFQVTVDDNDDSNEVTLSFSIKLGEVA